MKHLLTMLACCCILHNAQGKPRTVVAAYVRQDSFWMLIDTMGRRIDGQVILKENAASIPQLQGDSLWTEGILLRKSTRNGRERYRYYRQGGRPLIDTTFDLGEPFKDGYAAVMVGNDINWIDHDGRFLLPKAIPHLVPLNTAANALSDRLLILPPAKDKTCNCRSSLPLYSFARKNGQPAMDGSYIQADVFRHHRAAVSEDGIRFGFIDEAGTWIVPPVYIEAEGFAEVELE